MYTFVMEIIAYTDGSAIGNPGPGGWGFVVLKGNGVYEGGGDAPHTTNNRMEMTAALMALRSFKTKATLTLKTDSQYVINGITKWVFGWEQNGWQTKEKKEVLNKDIWQELVVEARRHEVTWEHVRGHEGVALNERVDMIANGYARKEAVQLFEGTKHAYDAFLATMPKARVVSKSASKSKKAGPAYSYVSCIEGKIFTYATWAECEAQVKGKKAKFKKVFSREEEGALIGEWGG
jgi:ribonuclease HI